MKAQIVTSLAALLCATAVLAEDYNVGTDSELRAAIANDGANITVTADIDLSNSTLSIASGTTVTINLGGHMLDRKLTKRGEGGGQVITVRSGATLNLSNGTLKGGWGGAGGALVNEGGMVTLTDVIITNNVADDRGGGICNREGGTLTMTGGVITDNSSNDRSGAKGGGGLFNEEGATATLTGITITGNTAKLTGGGGICNFGTLTIDGCTITGNTAGTQGGGIWQEGTLNMKGAMSVTGNTNAESGVANNLFLKNGKVITVTGSLTPLPQQGGAGGGSIIGITMQTAGTFTSGYNTYNNGTDPTTIFTPDLNGITAVSLDGNEAKLADSLPAGAVYYIERGWDNVNNKLTATVRTLESGFTTMSGKDGDLTLTGGTYVVQGNIRVSNLIYVEGNTNLILCDGFTLTVGKGILVSQDCRLSIFGQVSNSGRLVNEQEQETHIGINPWEEPTYPGIGTFSSGTTINIHGGTINVKARNGYAAAIGNGKGNNMNREMGTINIYGGNITATGGYCNDDIQTTGSAAIGSWDNRANGAVNIYGGNITAAGNKNGPGIGTGNYGDVGNETVFTITINGGSVAATGGYCAAGIGRGKTKVGDQGFGGTTPNEAAAVTGKTITINGGNVVATGDYYGAGIGGGQWGVGGTVIINGGRVEAHGGKSAAGIGSGETRSDDDKRVHGGTLEVNGGEVYAYGGEHGSSGGGAGIGGGGSCYGATVTVNGGKVYAYGGENAAGIGSGEAESLRSTPNGGILTVTGGEVYAYGDGDGAGIGGGEDARGAVVTINSGIVVAKSGGDQRAIGAGYGHDDHGSLTIADDMGVFISTQLYRSVRENRVIDCRNWSYVKVMACAHGTITYTINEGENTHTAHCKYCAKAFTPEAHTIVDGVCTVCGARSTNCTVSVYLPNGNTYGSPTTYTMATGAKFNLPAAPEANTPDYMEFAGWLEADPTGLSSFVTDGNETLLDADDEYTIGSSNVSFTARYRYINISLADDASNDAVFYTYDGKKAHSVTLTGRTLYKDGGWNTLCLPFSMTAEQVTAQLAPTELMELDTDAGSYDHITGFDAENGTLYLNFKDATSIEAGKPYLIKWASGDDITSPVFSEITINSGLTNVASTDGTLAFTGTYSPHAYTEENKSILYLGGGNTLYYPQPADAEHPITIGSCRAYFALNGITAGDPAAGVKAFVLNFDDSEDEPLSIVNYQSSIGEVDAWYDLSGRKMVNGLKKGIYIHNGRKEVLK